MTEKVGAWRIVEILVPLGTPLAVALIAYFFNTAESSRDQRNKTEQERIAKFALIPAFMDALSGDDEKKKTLAVRSVTAILGNDGEVLLAGIAGNDNAALSAEAQQIVDDAVRSRSTELANTLFSPRATERNLAFRDLVLSGISAEQVIPIIVHNGLENKDNIEGVKASLEYLQNADYRAINKWSKEVSTYIQAVENNGPATNALAQSIKERLAAPN